MIGHPGPDGEPQHQQRYLTWTNVEELDEVNEHFLALQEDSRSSVPHKQPAPVIDPTQWSPRYKLYLSALGAVANFSTTYAGGSYTSATTAMADDWHVSTTAVLVGITVYAVAFGIAPMFLAPLSEQNGRWPVVIVSGIVFVIGVLFCAVTHLYVGMLLARILVGLASSTFAVVIVGVVADIHTASEDRFFALTLFTGGAMFGNGFGPLVSGFIVQNTSWRWLFGVLDLFVFGMVVVLIATFKETRGSILLARRASALNRWYDSIERDSADSTQDDLHQDHSLSKVRWKVAGEEQRAGLAQKIKTSLTRPFFLLVTEPVVFWFSCWAGFSWSIMYALLIVVPYTFQTIYGFSLQTSSAIFAAMCIASVLMTIVSGFHDRIAKLMLSHRQLNSPEGVLYPVAIESTLLPAGLFWYGWTAQAGVHWIVPTLGLGCATMGMFSVYLAVFAYLAAAYKQYASSANAAQSMVRNLMGGAFPLFSKVMFQRLGFGGACSLLGAIGVILTFVPWILIVFGPRIRERSKYAFREDK